jgi:hypothetical protein
MLITELCWTDTPVISIRRLAFSCIPLEPCGIGARAANRVAATVRSATSSEPEAIQAHQPAQRAERVSHISVPSDLSQGQIGTYECLIRTPDPASAPMVDRLRWQAQDRLLGRE